MSMPKKPANYRELREELEGILNKLQQNDSGDIDEATVLYERGITVAKQLEEYLKSAKNNITELKSKKG